MKCLGYEKVPTHSRSLAAAVRPRCVFSLRNPDCRHAGSRARTGGDGLHGRGDRLRRHGSQGGEPGLRRRSGRHLSGGPRRRRELARRARHWHRHRGEFPSSCAAATRDRASWPSTWPWPCSTWRGRTSRWPASWAAFSWIASMPKRRHTATGNSPWSSPTASCTTSPSRRPCWPRRCAGRARRTIFIARSAAPGRRRDGQHLVATYAAGANDHQRKMFDDSLRAALSLAEIIDLAGELGLSPDTVQATSDRHWTLVARKG